MYFLFFYTTWHQHFRPSFSQTKRLDQVEICPLDTINNKYYKGQIRQQEQAQQKQRAKWHYYVHYNNNNDKSKRPVGRDSALLVRSVELYTLLQWISPLSWLPWKYQDSQPPSSHHVNFVGQRKKWQKLGKRKEKWRKNQLEAIGRLFAKMAASLFSFAGE